MEPRILYRVIYGTPEPTAWQKKQTTIRPALLRGFRRQQVRNADYPAIVPVQNPATIVRGAFISGLSDLEVMYLDHYEGEQYKRQRVKVKLLKNLGLEDDVAEESLASLEGEEVDAWTYVWSDSAKWLAEKDWNFDYFRKHRMQAWTGESSLTMESVDERFTAADDVAAVVAATAAQARAESTRPEDIADLGTDSTESAGQGSWDRGRGKRGRGEHPRGEQRGRGGRVGGDQGGNFRAGGDRGSSVRGASAQPTSGRCTDVQSRGDRRTVGRDSRDRDRGDGQGVIRRGSRDGGSASRGKRGTASDELKAALEEWKKVVHKTRRRL